MRRAARSPWGTPKGRSARFKRKSGRLQPGRPATWGLEGTLSGAHQAAPIVHEIGRQAQMIGYLNAFMFFALTALVAMPLILAVRPPKY